MTLMERNEIDALLVFHANGTLTAKERQHVETAMARDPELADDLSLLQALRAEMREEPMPTAGTLAQQRLLAAIAKTPQDFGAPQAAPEIANNTTKPSGGWNVMRLVAVIALAALVAQSAFFWRGSDAPGYELASSGIAGDLIVAFQPSATEEMIRDTLLSLDLQIVSGPSALGLYRLSSEDPQTGVEALAARQDVIESVENASQ